MSTTAIRFKAALEEFDSGTICNSIELFGMRPKTWGYTDSRLWAASLEMRPVVGFASTLTFRSSQHGNADRTHSLEDHINRFAELSGPPFVIIQDLDDPPHSAVFGEIMCSQYKAFGAVSLATNGAGRDLVDIRAMDFPVFSNGWVPGRGHARFLDIHVPVSISGVLLRPNDVIHADGNGLVQIPIEIVDQLPDVAAEYRRAEKLILDAIAADEPSSITITEARKARASECARIRKELSVDGS